MVNEQHASTGSRAVIPDDQAIASAAMKLSLVADEICTRLATELLGNVNDTEKNSDRSSSRVRLELTKIRILRMAKMDFSGAAVTARLAGATWVQIGAACETTRQAAYLRWGEEVKQFQEARRIAQHHHLDVLDEYDPTGGRPIQALYQRLQATPTPPGRDTPP